MSNNHFTTKTIWTLSRCYIATSNKFFHNPNSAMHFYSNPRAKSCIYKDESLNKSSFYLTLILVYFPASKLNNEEDTWYFQSLHAAKLQS